MGEVGDYCFIDQGGQRIGAIMTAADGWPKRSCYFNVPSIDAAVARIASGGDAVTMGPNEVPGGVHIVLGTDPQGCRVRSRWREVTRPQVEGCGHRQPTRRRERPASRSSAPLPALAHPTLSLLQPRRDIGICGAALDEIAGPRARSAAPGRSDRHNTRVTYAARGPSAADTEATGKLLRRYFPDWQIVEAPVLDADLAPNRIDRSFRDHLVPLSID